MFCCQRAFYHRVIYSLGTREVPGKELRWCLKGLDQDADGTGFWMDGDIICRGVVVIRYPKNRFSSCS